MERVTEILKIIADSGLEKFKRGVGFQKFDAIMEAKAKIGIRNHKMFRDYITSGIDSIGDPVRRDCDSEAILQDFIGWYGDNVAEPISCEIRMENAEYRYSGQPDLVFRHKDGRRILLDYKFVDKLIPVYIPQLCAYEHLHPKGLIDEIWIMWWRKKKEIWVPEIYEIERADRVLGWNLFLSALSWFRYIRDFGAR